ncbi:hypothetical protein [Mycobacterium sp. DL440]|uniref:hypothetical protein n=1 Tax=Mycobacterium sp. DL440 TaxID=2675523 RepID=UPI001421F135|nr:hypothetical protein [Mycobacterium sp. DL440]
MADVAQRARELLAGITRWPWQWNDYRVPDLMGRAGDPDIYEYDIEVLEASHSGECGCRSSCELELTISDADKAFIAAAPQLVAELADKLSEIRQILADDDARGAMPGFITVNKIREALERDR